MGARLTGSCSSCSFITVSLSLLLSFSLHSVTSALPVVRSLSCPNTFLVPSLFSCYDRYLTTSFLLQSFVTILSAQVSEPLPVNLVVKMVIGVPQSHPGGAEPLLSNRFARSGVLLDYVRS